jgi:hypothetical protein
MDVPFYASNAQWFEERERSTSSMRTANTATQSPNTVALAQLDGEADYHARTRPEVTRNNYGQTAAPRSFPQHHHHSQPARQARNIQSVPSPPRQQTRGTGNAFSDLLPYCTTEPPLNEAQVIALSDVVGCLRELVLLALGAASGDVGGMEKLERAVGQQAALRIAEFFAENWVLDG